jgi:hypothetical protein
MLSMEAPVNGSSNYELIVVVKVGYMLEHLDTSVVLAVFAVTIN